MTLKNIQKIGYNCIDKVKQLTLHYLFKSQFKKWLKNQGFENKKYPGEDAYIAKWKQLSKRVEPYSYRFFSHYCGLTPDIIPEDIAENIIQSKLSPPRYRDVYSDKNLYSQFFGEGICPKTYLCRINGGPILGGNYVPLSVTLEDFLSSKAPHNFKVVLKPSIDSCGGEGIIIFEKKENKWISINSTDVLNDNLLNEYGRDWVLQEEIKQHPDLAYFNPSSLNSIRICCYRSVKDDTVHIPSAVLRIGGKGSICDNATAGGRFVGINVQNGALGKYICDKYGNKSEIYNEIDFNNNNFYIPYWDKIIEFSRMIASKNLHCRAMGLDVTVDENGNCKLIEYNVKLFGFKLFMYSGQTVFGDHLQEIIDYCKNN